MTPCKIPKKLIFSSSFLRLLIVVVGAVLVSPHSHAAAVRIQDREHNEITYFAIDYKGSAEDLIAPLREALSSVLKHSIYNDRLPNRFAVLIDSNWQGAPAYWSPLLFSQDGDPAILFKPRAILGNTKLRSLVSHELTHLVHHQFRADEEAWVREGLALVSEYLVTGFLNASIEEGFKTTETSLTEVIDPRLEEQTSNHIRSAQYGHILQYFYYLYKLCGKEKLFDLLLTTKSEEKGIGFINEILALSSQLGYSQSSVCVDFKSSFIAFEKARFLRNFLKPEEHILLGSFKATIRDAKTDIPPYSATAYKKTKDDCAQNDYDYGNYCLRIRLN